MMERVVMNDLEQGTPEWLSARLGIPTASEAECLLVAGKGPHGLGVGAQTYARRVAAEVILGAPLPTAETYAMRLGTEYEPELRAEYELTCDAAVFEVGMVQLPEVAGYSPDGLVGDDGAVEIKTRNPAELIARILGEPLSKGEMAQIQFGLWVSGRAWCDYVAGYPGMPSHIRRVERDEGTIEKLADAVARFNKYVAEIVEVVRTA